MVRRKQPNPTRRTPGGEGFPGLGPSKEDEGGPLQGLLQEGAIGSSLPCNEKYWGEGKRKEAELSRDEECGGVDGDEDFQEGGPSVRPKRPRGGDVIRLPCAGDTTGGVLLCSLPVEDVGSCTPYQGFSFVVSPGSPVLLEKEQLRWHRTLTEEEVQQVEEPSDVGGVTVKIRRDQEWGVEGGTDVSAVAGVLRMKSEVFTAVENLVQKGLITIKAYFLDSQSGSAGVKG
ncbi:unnamed protein product, partial [Choristocarpus tenellus]